MADRYQSRITDADSDGDVYALIVRVDSDGSENVIHGYKGRHLSSRRAAERSTSQYIAKHGLND